MDFVEGNRARRTRIGDGDGRKVKRALLSGGSISRKLDPSEFVLNPDDLRPPERLRFSRPSRSERARKRPGNRLQ